MTANYVHGIETIEVERGPRAVRVVKSAVIGLVGAAPTGPVNELTLCLSGRDDSRSLGGHPRFRGGDGIGGQRTEPFRS